MGGNSAQEWRALPHWYVGSVSDCDAEAKYKCREIMCGAFHGHQAKVQKVQGDTLFLHFLHASGRTNVINLRKKKAVSTL